MTPSFLSSTSNGILHASFSIVLTVILSVLNLPTLFLHGLHTYIHPDDVNPPNNSSNGIRAAIRRPGSSDAELKPRKKSKEKFEFDENKAQIFRLKLNHGHLQTRLFSGEYTGAFNFTIVAASSLLLHNFLTVSKDHGVLKNGSVVPILLGFVGICRIFLLISMASFQRSASKKLERQLSFIFGILGFLLGLLIVYEIVPNWVFDFQFESIDGFGKFSVAVLMGSIVGFLYIPALKNARAFWLGTDQIRSNLSMISCGWISRTLLYANYIMCTFTSLLWINPFTEILKIKPKKALNSIDQNSKYGVLVGNLGMIQSDFEKFWLFCLLISGLLQLLTLRSNVQMYLNEAVLCWYQRLHSSKVPDMDFSRAKVFLHNHYLILAVLQFFAPAALILLFLGLSQIHENLFKNFQQVCVLIPCSALVKEVALFMAWWVVYVWAIFSSAILILYRRGNLYVS